MKATLAWSSSVLKGAILAASADGEEEVSVPGTRGRQSHSLNWQGKLKEVFQVGMAKT